MYTQCPNCNTIFSTTAADLDAHEGLVRCGRCEEIFNASWNLVDQLPVEVEAPTIAAPMGQTQEPAPIVPQKPTPIVINATAPNISDEPKEPKVAASKPEIDRPQDPQPGFSPPPKLNPPIESSADPVNTPPGLDLPPEPVSQESTLPPQQTYPGEVSVSDHSEQIIIEAPSTLWNFEENQGQIVSTDDSTTDADTMKNVGAGGAKSQETPDEGEPTRRSSAKARVAHPSAGSAAGPERRRLSKSRVAPDVKLVEIPQPQIMRTAVWSLATVFALLLIVFQMREFYLNDLAQIQALRPTLASVCNYIACSVPPRSDLESIDLVGTSVNPHPEVPGALRVSVNLMNRAVFEQAYPSLEITLTDKEGAVVGKRTYLPREYGESNEDSFSPRVIKRIDLDLATPTELAVGYEINLVAR